MRNNEFAIKTHFDTNYNNIGFLKHIFKLNDGTDTMFYDFKALS